MAAEQAGMEGHLRQVEQTAKVKQTFQVVTVGVRAHEDRQGQVAEVAEPQHYS